MKGSKKNIRINEMVDDCSTIFLKPKSVLRHMLAKLKPDKACGHSRNCQIRSATQFLGMVLEAFNDTWGPNATPPSRWRSTRPVVNFKKKEPTKPKKYKPITIALVRGMGYNPFPYVLAEIMFSNIGGALTLVGDPPNILVGTSVGISFNSFIPWKF